MEAGESSMMGWRGKPGNKPDAMCDPDCHSIWACQMIGPGLCPRCGSSSAAIEMRNSCSRDPRSFGTWFVCKCGNEWPEEDFEFLTPEVLTVEPEARIDVDVPKTHLAAVD